MICLLRIRHRTFSHFRKRLTPRHRLFSNYESPEEEVPPDFRPRRIILMRHGQSQGNIDQNAYVTTPDWCIPVTDLGREQARDAGKRLRSQIGQTEKVLFYFSPYLRTKQTLDEIIPFFNEDEILGIMEEPRISDQQIGNFQNVQEVLDAKSERSKFGRFFYRFPSGEAGLDVYSRVSSFIPTLVRDCNQLRWAGNDLNNMNIVIVTHGHVLRLFLMRWFQFSVHDFEGSVNPNHCEMITMTKMQDSQGRAWLELEEKDRLSLRLPDSCGIPRNVRLHGFRCK